MTAAELTGIVGGLESLAERWMRMPGSVGADHLLRLERLRSLAPDSPSLAGELRSLSAWLRAVGSGGSLPVHREHLQLADEIERVLG